MYLKIARVFPRRTKATPDDPLAFTGPPPKGGLPDMEEVHVSVAFTYDMEKACQLAEQWMKLGVPVHMGGPAFNMPGGDFVPGMYLKKGYVITSRGCPNRCWFCSVPRREGGRLRELPITEGNIVLDDNLLACSRKHIEAVFDMLGRQKERPIFTGGPAFFGPGMWIFCGNPGRSACIFPMIPRMTMSRLWRPDGFCRPEDSRENHTKPAVMS